MKNVPNVVTVRNTSIHEPRFSCPSTEFGNDIMRPHGGPKNRPRDTNIQNKLVRTRMLQFKIAHPDYKETTIQVEVKEGESVSAGEIKLEKVKKEDA
jgi:hypothetical protein